MYVLLTKESAMQVYENDFIQIINRICVIERAHSINAVMLNLLQTAAEFIDFQYCVFFLFDKTSKQIVRHAIVQIPNIETPVRELARFLQDKFPFYYSDNIKAPDDANCVLEETVDSSYYQLAGTTIMIACFAEDSELYGSLCVCKEQGAFSDLDRLLMRALQPSALYKIKEFSVNGHLEAEKRKEFKEQFGLSPREIEIADCITNGMNTIDIANKLNISSRTADKHLEHIYRKTGMNNRLSLIKFIQVYLQD